MEERIKIGGKTIFIAGLILWGFMLIALIVAFLGNKSVTILRALLALCCLILLIIGLALLYYLWGDVVLSGSCGFMREIMNENRDVLNEVDASDDLRNIMNECFFRNDSRSFTAAETNLHTSRDDIVRYFDGLVRH